MWFSWGCKNMRFFGVAKYVIFLDLQKYEKNAIFWNLQSVKKHNFWNLQTMKKTQFLEFAKCEKMKICN
jgi:uncharacterized membrane protein YwzB